MVKFLFQGVEFATCFNDKILSSFHINKGVKQGRSLAPYLFLIMGEIINFMFKQAVANGKIKGITMLRGGKQYISVLMISTMLVLVGDEVNVNRKMDLKNYFF
jgi:hypothetical protein